jgi:hypothetical protein
MEKIRQLAKELATLCEKEDVSLLCVFGNTGSKLGYEACFPEGKTHDLISKANTTLMNNSTSKRRSLDIEA